MLSAQRGQTSLLLRRLATQLKSLLVITSLLGVWYASNIFFNIYNKQVLQVFPHATTCTFLHLVTASVLMGTAWLIRLKDRPVITRRTVESVIPLGILHLVGFLATNMSLGAVNVSLTHTIKSLEPFFTVFLSFIFLGSVPTLPVMLTLVPIVAGVVIASATDLSFNWYGFTTAMASNLAFQSRNVISKKYMVESSLESLEDTQAARSVLDEINLFAFISIAATFLMVPILFALDGPSLWAAYCAASGSFTERIATVMPWSVVQKTLLAGLCRTADVLASYALLSRLNPVTHSVGNCVKRVVVIAVSIVFFKTPASYLNIIGTALALSGVFAYSMAKRMSKDRPDLRASLRATIKLQNFLAGLVPEGIKRAIARKEAEKAEKAAKEKQMEAAKRKESPDEPEYFL
jgi:solute carrier family 35 protein E1